MADLHELVSALKDLYLELGRTPTKQEFCNSFKGAHYAMVKTGGYAVICQAAGLEMLGPGGMAKKIDNTIFKRDIERHVNTYVPDVVITRPTYPKIAVISDIHWPFHSQRVLDAFHEFCRAHQPDLIFLNGDAWDMYSHSKFPRSHNVFTPRDEQNLARTANERFWDRCKKDCPNAVCTQMLGNHDLRPLKRVVESYPEAEDWVTEKVNSLFTFDGVKTITDPREEVILGDIAVFHGYRSQLGSHRDFTLMNCVNGHSHVGGVVFRQIRGQVLWEANSGYAGDPLTKGLTYTPQKITNWTHGFLFIWPWGPQFIPV